MLRFVVYSLMTMLAVMPLRLNRWCGRLVGRLMVSFDSRYYHSTLANLNYCQPHLTAEQRIHLAKSICLSCGETLTETAWLWRRPYGQIEPRISKVEGKELIDTAIANGKGVLLAGAHLGSWELFCLWAGANYPFTAMYKPSKTPLIDHLVRSGRSRTQARLLSGVAKNFRSMLSLLKNQQILGILTDQEPAVGSGCYAPFFRRPALTMTIIQRLQQKTGAKVLLFEARRTDDGFTIRISDPLLDNPTLSKEHYAADLNKSLEQLIDSNMTQYQWGYKRFKTPPNELPNIYYK